MDLSISIVSWNVKEDLRRCLKSVYDTADNLSFEVIVVDNSSSDGSAQMIKDGFPHVKLIENRRNLGFAAANNQAIKQVKAKYTLLLNPDTIVLPGTIKGMVDFMDSHTEVGISSCTKLGQDGEQSRLGLSVRRYNPFPSFEFYKYLKGAILSRFARLFPNSKIIKKHIFNNIDILTFDFILGTKDKPVEVNVVWGSFMMIREEVIKRVGGLDERFFFGVDDDDFCYRVRRAGWKIYLNPQYKIVHLAGRSIGQWSEKDKKDIVIYSLFMFYSKHKGKIWLCSRGIKIISSKIIIAGILLIFDAIFITRGLKSKKGDDRFSPVSMVIRNLFRVVFNISPKFNRY